MLTQQRNELKHNGGQRSKSNRKALQSQKLGTQLVKNIGKQLNGAYDSVKEAVPFIGQVEDFYNGSADRGRQRLLARGYTEKQIESANGERQALTKNGEATSKFIQSVSDKTNIAPEIIQAGASLAELLIDKRIGGRMATDTLSGAARIRPAEVAQALTIKNPDSLARGAAQGWAAGSEFGDAMTQWRNRRMELRERMRYPSGTTAGRREKNRRKALKAAYNDVSTGPTRFPDNPKAYEVTKFRQQSTVDGRNMEQHHLFPKQESYQFVERMLEVGDEDDVLNLMIFAEEVDASMGGRLDNMLNMDSDPHKILHNSRMAREDGRQLKSMQMKNLVDNAKTSDELMELFKTYIETNIKPSKQEARSLQHLYELAKKQGKHKEMYTALKNKGR